MLKNKRLNISDKKLNDTFKEIVEYLNNYNFTPKFDDRKIYVDFDYKENLIFHLFFF